MEYSAGGKRASSGDSKKTMRHVYQISLGGRSFGAWPHNLGSVAFFSKTKPKLEKVVNYFPLKCHLL